MDLNKYLPSKTLLWKDWRSTWGTTAFLIGVITAASSIKLLYSIMNVMRYPEIFMNTVAFPDMNSFLGFILMLLTVALAATMMGQEREQNTFNLLLAMPYTRSQIMHSKFMVGLGLILASFSFNALIMTIAIWANQSIHFLFGPAEIWTWAVRYTLVLWYIFAFTMVISTVSGTTKGNIILALIFLFFPIGFLSLGALNILFWADTYIYQLLVDITSWGSVFQEAGLLLTIPTYIIYSNLIWDKYASPWLYSLLILVTPGLYLLSQHLFAKNQLENNGEVLMFEKLEGFFKAGVAVCFALVGGPILMESLNVQPGDGAGSLVLGMLLYLAVGAIFWLGVQRLIIRRKAT